MPFNVIRSQDRLSLDRKSGGTVDCFRLQGKANYFDFKSNQIYCNKRINDTAIVAHDAYTAETEQMLYNIK